MDGAQAGLGSGSKMEPQRIVGISFVIFAALSGMFLSRVLAAAFTALKWNNTQLFGVEELTLSGVIGFAIAIGGSVVAYLNPKVKEVSLDVASEMKKVTWPTIAETRVATVACIIATLVASGILFVFDFLSSKIMTVWLPAFFGWLARL